MSAFFAYPVKILSLPDENKIGYFINANNNSKKIILNEIIYSPLSFDHWSH